MEKYKTENACVNFRKQVFHDGQPCVFYCLFAKEVEELVETLEAYNSSPLYQYLKYVAFAADRMYSFS